MNGGGAAAAAAVVGLSRNNPGTVDPDAVVMVFLFFIVFFSCIGFMWWMVTIWSRK